VCVCLRAWFLHVNLFVWDIVCVCGCVLVCVRANVFLCVCVLMCVCVSGQGACRVCSGCDAARRACVRTGPGVTMSSDSAAVRRAGQERAAS
jgi:hypothetical protein